MPDGFLPPRLPERLLRACLDRTTPAVSFVVGDLREEYAWQRRRRSRAGARLWYWFMVVRLIVRLRWEHRGAMTSTAGVRTSSSRGAGGHMRIELKQAVRFLVRRPGFSGAIVLTVALAIAATTVAFAVVDAVLLEELPYDDPQGLVVVWEWNVERNRETNVVSPANFLTWRERARSFSDLSSAIAFSVTRTGEGEPERVGGVQTTAAFFRIFGASPLIGRLYGEAEDAAGGEDVVVLSEGYWRRAFGADPSLIGRTIVLNGTPNTVIGVLPASFDVPIEAEFGSTGTHDIWFPAQFSEEARSFSGRYLQVFGRLQPGVSLEAARAEMTALAEALRAEFPVRQAGWDVNVVTLRDQLVGDVRATLLVIFGAVSFVLLIACGNVANLLLTRASARQQEIAVRSALGAGRGRLVRQLLIESMLLSLAGGAAGLVLAFWALRSLMVAAPDIPRLETLGLDVSVVAFTLLVTIVTALLFGLAPALHLVGGDLAGWLKDRGSGNVRRGGNWLRSTLVIVQVALSLVLLVGAGLLIRSFANRMALGIGFDMQRLLTAEINLPGSRYDVDAQKRFFEDLVERVQSQPALRQSSAITFAPLAGSGSATSFWPADRPMPRPEEQPVADLRWVHRDYHRVAGIPLLAGRSFDETDRADAPLRVVINESGARQLWPGEDAVGKRIAMPWGDTLHAEVIGVVGDVLFNGPETELRPMFYWDHRQFRPFSQMTLLVRTRGTPTQVVPTIRATVRSLDPDLPLFNVRTMDDLYADALARPRFATIALGLFAALALLIAATGIYGVISYATQLRAREIGIRLALGAARSDVVRMVIAQGVVLIAIAVTTGALGALSLTRFLQGLVFDVSTTDPVTFAAMAALLSGIALLACWVPARRASTIDPVEAIRHER